MNINLITLAGLIPLLAAPASARLQVRRRQPYGMEDFVKAAKRIAAHLEGVEADLLGHHRLPEGISLLRDIREGTVFMLTVASESSRDALRRTPPSHHAAIWKNLKEIHAAGTSLLRRIRLARWQYALAPAHDSGDRSLLDASQQFVALCASFGGLLREQRSI